MKRSYLFVVPVMISAIFASRTDLWAKVDSAPTYTFRSDRTVGKTDRVEVRLEVGGDTQYIEDNKPQTKKMSIACNLDYADKTIDIPSGAAGAWRSVRDYEKVDAQVKVGDGQFKPALKPQHYRIAVESAREAVTLFSPDGNMTRDELDAIDIQGNTLLLDQFLPEKAMAIGESWPLSADQMAAFLRLDQAAKSTVECTLKEVAEDVARFEIAGRVEGAIDGVATNVEIKGRLRFDRRINRVDWLGMLIQEKHESSFVSDGMDVVSRLAIKVAPVDEPARLSDESLAKLDLKPTTEAVCLSYESPNGDWNCALDRRWYVYHQRPKIDTAVLRYIDRGEFAGQCNLSSLPQRKPETLVSLEQYQEDIKKALGKSFGEFVEAGQNSNEANYRVYRVAVNGTSSDIPMCWIYYLVADQFGRQVTFTFAVEQKHLERFAQADRALVESMRFADKDK
jgi:hypothetical protein